MRIYTQYGAAIVAAILLSGCASNPDDMTATYVSPIKYKDYSCQQLFSETSHLERRINTIYHQLKKENTKDKWQAAGGFLLWPVFLTLEGGDSPVSGEYVQLKGEYEAIRIASTLNNCGIEVKSAEEMIKDLDAKDASTKDSETAN